MSNLNKAEEIKKELANFITKDIDANIRLGLVQTEEEVNVLINNLDLGSIFQDCVKSILKRYANTLIK